MLRFVWNALVPRASGRTWMSPVYTERARSSITPLNSRLLVVSRARVILEGAEVEQLVAAAEVQRLQHAGGAATDEAAVSALTRRVTAEDRGRCGQRGSGVDSRGMRRKLPCAGPELLHVEIAEASIALDDDLDHRRQHQRVGG